MCCCDKPTINGEFGYKWQPSHAPGIYHPYPPELNEGDVIMFDEPGRCVKGLDAHSHHYRLVANHGSFYLTVQHGGGKEQFRLSQGNTFIDLLLHVDSNTRYRALHTLYYAYHEGRDRAREATNAFWQTAAVEKRIRTRKQRGTGNIKVWVQPKIITKEEPR